MILHCDTENTRKTYTVLRNVLPIKIKQQQFNEKTAKLQCNAAFSILFQQSIKYKKYYF